MAFSSLIASLPSLLSAARRWPAAPMFHMWQSGSAAELVLSFLPRRSPQCEGLTLLKERTYCCLEKDYLCHLKSPILLRVDGAVHQELSEEQIEQERNVRQMDQDLSGRLSTTIGKNKGALM